MPVVPLKTVNCLCAILILTLSLTFAADVAAGPAFGPWGVDLAALNKEVKPGDNFFEYVNGAWLRTAQIAADRSSTGTFEDLELLSESRLRAIVEALEARPYAALTDEERKLRDLYDAFEDEQQIEARDIKPVEADLAAIAALDTPGDVARAMGSVRLRVTGPYRLDIGVDDKEPNAYSVTFRNAASACPTATTTCGTTRAGHDARRLQEIPVDNAALAGLTDTDKRAAAIFALETKIANAHWTRAPIAATRPRSTTR